MSKKYIDEVTFVPSQKLGISKIQHPSRVQRVHRFNKNSTMSS